MEHHRLKPMKQGYDEKLFNTLYKKTTPLRKKLAFSIDARKFGVDYNEVLSWFDVKFIHTFNKYYDLGPDLLLGHIINALNTYKYRIMRSSYQLKYHNHTSMVDITELYNHSLIVDDGDTDRSPYYDAVISFMKSKLSDDALLILEIELSPPPFILESMDDIDKKANSKIPTSIIADYLGLSKSSKAEEYINQLRADIKYVTQLAKKFFSDNPSFVF